MEKILQLIGGGEAIGGVETMLLNYYAHIERTKVRFDFFFYRRSTFDTVKAQYPGLLDNSKVFELNAFKGSSSFGEYIRTIKPLAKILRDNGYKIVHINAGRPALLICGLVSALIAGTKVRILHSHSTGGVGIGRMAKMVHSFVQPFFRKKATYLFGCSTEAGRYMFGEKEVNGEKYRAIHNAIEVEKFSFSTNVRDKVRKQLGIENDMIVYGHVGRFSPQKNHPYLIDIFSEVCRRNKKSVLLLVGDGDAGIKKDVMERIARYGVQANVRLLGERKDVNELYQAFDALLFPSLWEGLSVVLIEAQCAGLPVFASDSISPEHKVSPSFTFISLNKTPEEWATIIENGMNEVVDRVKGVQWIKEARYDVETEALRLQQLYLNA